MYRPGLGDKSWTRNVWDAIGSSWRASWDEEVAHAPRGMLEFWADPTSAYHREEFDPARRTILYCASGGRSALAADTLQRMGYANVAHLDGGIKAWKEGGRPVEEVGPGGQ
jgi:rhodanese-related sulfurtransferase